MADPITIESFPEDQRANVQTMLDTAAATSKTDTEKQIGELKSTHDTNMGKLQTRFDDIEVELAGKSTSSIGGTGGGELNARQKEILAGREATKTATEAAAVLKGKDDEIATLNASAFTRLKADAKVAKIPDAIVALASTPRELENEIIRFKVARGDTDTITPSSPKNPTATVPSTPSSREPDAMQAMTSLLLREGYKDPTI